MNPFPYLSLVLTSYNQERYIREALLSVLAQDYKGRMELIVVDDASTDRSADIIEEVLRGQGGAWDCRFVRMERNAGVALAVDRALGLARGEWVVLMDGDDVQFPDRCRKTAELIAQHPDAVLINMSAELIDSGGRPYGRKSYAFAAFDKAPELAVCAAPADRCRNCLTFNDDHIDPYGCTMAMRLDLFRRWGALGDGMKETFFAQDSPWALRAFLSGKIVGSLALACRYRSHGSNLLNREWKGGAQAVRDQELFQARYQKFFADTHRRMAADVQRAIDEPGLSDWEPAGLRALAAHERRELFVADLRGEWWSLPWRQRFKRTVCSIGRLPCRMTLWPWLRLLPFSLVCRIRALKFR